MITKSLLFIVAFVAGTLFSVRSEGAPSSSADVLRRVLTSPEPQYKEELGDTMIEIIAKASVNEQKQILADLMRRPDIAESVSFGRALRMKLLHVWLSEDKRAEFDLPRKLAAELREKLSSRQRKPNPASYYVAQARTAAALGLDSLNALTPELQRTFNKTLFVELMRESPTSSNENPISDGWLQESLLMIRQRMTEYLNEYLRFGLQHGRFEQASKLSMNAEVTDLTLDFLETAQLVFHPKLVSKYVVEWWLVDPAGHTFMPMVESVSVELGDGTVQNLLIHPYHPLKTKSLLAPFHLEDFEADLELDLRATAFTGVRQLFILLTEALNQRMTTSALLQALDRWTQSYLTFDQFRSDITEFTSSPAEDEPLAPLISDLRWAGFRNGANHWINRVAAADFLPDWQADFEAGLGVNSDLFSPEIQTRFHVDALFEHSLGSVADHKQFRYLSELEMITGAHRRVGAETGSADVEIKSLKRLPVYHGWVALPSILHHAPASIEVTGPRILTDDRDFELHYFPHFEAYAILIKDPSVQSLDVTLGLKDIGSEPFELIFPPDKLEEIADELSKFGETQLSGAIRRAVLPSKVTVTDWARLIKTNTSYTYHPERRPRFSDSKLNMFENFLDDNGRLCFQCSQAANLMVQTPVMAFSGRSDLEFKSVSGLARGAQTLLPQHAIVEVRENGRVRARLDPTPSRKDTRAPYSGSFEERSAGRELKLKKDELEREYREFLEVCSRAAHRDLPDSSPLLEFTKAFALALRGFGDLATVQRRLDLLILASNAKLPHRHLAVLQSSTEKAGDLVEKLKQLRTRECEQILDSHVRDDIIGR